MFDSIELRSEMHIEHTRQATVKVARSKWKFERHKALLAVSQCKILEYLLRVSFISMCVQTDGRTKNVTLMDFLYELENT